MGESVFGWGTQNATRHPGLRVRPWLVSHQSHLHTAHESSSVLPMRCLTYMSLYARPRQIDTDCKLQTADRLLGRPIEEGAKPKRMLTVNIDRKILENIVWRMNLCKTESKDTFPFVKSVCISSRTKAKST